MFSSFRLVMDGLSFEKHAKRWVWHKPMNKRSSYARLNGVNVTRNGRTLILLNFLGVQRAKHYFLSSRRRCLAKLAFPTDMGKGSKPPNCSPHPKNTALDLRCMEAWNVLIWLAVVESWFCKIYSPMQHGKHYFSPTRLRFFTKFLFPPSMERTLKMNNFRCWLSEMSNDFFTPLD